MKKSIFALLLLMSMALSAQNQWTYLRTLSYNLPEGPPPNHIMGYSCDFDGVGYASMDFGLYGTTIYTIYSYGGGPTSSDATVYKIDELTGEMTVVYSESGYGVVGTFMFTEKKLGKVYRFGSYQGIPNFRVLDSLGNVSAIMVHPWGWSRCFSALDENHLYSIYDVNYSGGYHHILYSMINGVGTAIDTFSTFTSKKIDFPAVDRGYMYVVDHNTAMRKLLRSSTDLRSWDTIYKTSNPIVDFTFDEVNTGYAVIYPGIIIKTTDGGEVWDTIYNNISDTLYKIDVVNENILFACGNNGLILRTIDGGAEWTQDPFTSTDNLYQIIMFDENNGYAMSGRNCYRLTSSTVPVPDINNPQFNIAPNPSVGATKITSKDEIKTLEIIDNTGKVLLVQKVDSEEFILNYTPQSTGIYFIKVTFFNGKQKTEKILFAH
ncbi:MAG TPA: T9SS type A sorting domain-containing protein [Bacteroidales bacterium]|nr:T9SS type A sorting domain-containing protein [Bacteroidales bacterium]